MFKKLLMPLLGVVILVSGFLLIFTWYRFTRPQPNCSGDFDLLITGGKSSMARDVRRSAAILAYAISASPASAISMAQTRRL